jgi:hypothetical protein
MVAEKYTVRSIKWQINIVAEIDVAERSSGRTK